MLFDRDLLAFIGVAAIVVVTPGPDMVLVTSHALTAGRSAARLAAVGVCAGVLVHAAAATIGLSAALATSSLAFTVVKVAGAAFLVGLGLRAIWSARRRPAVSDEPAREVWTGTASIRVGSSPFWQGFWSNVLNPKVALLFLSLLPQFVDPGEGAFTQTLVLSATFLVMGIVWLLVYAAVASRAANVLRHDRVRRRIEIVSGTVLVALGLRVAVQDA